MTTSAYLYREELAELVGCSDRSVACMKRWLTKNEWPFVIDRNGFPKVLRTYHEQKLMGIAPKKSLEGTTEPNFACFDD